MDHKRKDKRFNELKAEIIQAVAHPIRLAIIDYLANGEQCVCDIVDYVEAQRSNVSRHLNIMLKAGVLSSRKDGLKVIYSLEMYCLTNVLDCIEASLIARIEKQNRLIK